MDLSFVESEYQHIVSDLADPKLSLLSQSHAVFLEMDSTETPREAHQAAAINGEVVSESESDNHIDSDRSRDILKKKIQAIRLKSRRDRMKLVAQIQRKVSRGALATCPDIGKHIEEYVQERSGGADMWRCTGVLTFDGNSTVKEKKEKMTYSKIKEHLESLYKCKFVYGTVIQLCIARNRRRTSAKGYKGVAKVTS